MPMPRRTYVTTRAHEVFALAHELADRLGHDEVTPSHLALGVIREGRSLAVGILLNRGVPLDAVSRDLEATLAAPGVARAPTHEPSWTSSDERMLDRARVEADALWPEFVAPEGSADAERRRVVGCEQIVLAFLRDTTSAPAEVLGRNGIGFADFRDAVLRAYQPPAEGDAPVGH